MNRELAKQLKAAGFPIARFRAGHKFYPGDGSSGWSAAAQKHGVILHPYDLQERLGDLKDGYYCPSLSDLIAACGDRFARLSIEQAIWTAQSTDPAIYALAHSAEEAVAKLWFALRKGAAPGGSRLLCGGR
ncbi:MAG TPA: hypothetical protein VEK75_05135 [Xanthobacteraceae bacterium]|nr:hypothetical protein [Xanthobacteraceae bacterium]